MHTCMLSFNFPSSRTFNSRNNWPLGQNIPGNVYPGHLFLRTDFPTIHRFEIFVMWKLGTIIFALLWRRYICRYAKSNFLNSLYFDVVRCPIVQWEHRHIWADSSIFTRNGQFRRWLLRIYCGSSQTWRGWRYRWCAVSVFGIDVNHIIVTCLA